MTPQEIIREIEKLPLQDQQEIKDSIETAINSGPSAPMSEEEFLRMMYARGIVGNIPDLSNSEEDAEWEPVEILGKPTSEIIIEDRG
jgi:hypothetical protein